MLIPCGQKTGQAELMSCLTLCAPTGMTQDERRQWLAVARETLRGCPEDLLKRGCAAARANADHPAKIVPAIMKEIRESWEKRKLLAVPADPVDALPPPRPHISDRDRSSFGPADWAELNEHLEAVGAAARYTETGEKYMVKDPPKRKDDTAPRRPTREDYIELGVDPVAIDAAQKEEGV